MLNWMIEFPGCNFAIITGITCVVLDLDVRSRKNGLKAFQRLAKEHGQQLPVTVTSVSGSGSGSLHLFFKIPANLNNLAKPQGLEGVDFLRSKQGVVVPGSRHESGQYYRFAPGLSPNEVTMAELPEWLLKLMTTDGKPANNFDELPDLSGDDGLFEFLLKSGPPEGSIAPGRLRSDEIVLQKMKSVDERKFADRSTSDLYYAFTLARNSSHHWSQYLRIWRLSSIRSLPGSKCGRSGYEVHILRTAFLNQKQQWQNHKRRSRVKTGDSKLAKRIRHSETKRTNPRSRTAFMVLALIARFPDWSNVQIAKCLNAKGELENTLTSQNVRTIRYAYKHDPVKS